YAVLGNFQVPLPDIPTVPPQIVLGIRPENVRIAQPSDTQTIQGRVYLVENLGMHYLVSVRIEGSQTGAITVRALLPTDQHWSGEDITLALPPEDIHWFDVQSGHALVKRQRTI
ncbi:MAG: TOBE domain-containing protein, partial [Fischerella sp.]|nr:TOBE domain-containing protein [Fischerella sp.]